MVVALNKVDATDDEELLDLAEIELRELLTAYDFPGDDIPIVRLSALNALEEDNISRESEWCKGIWDLVDAVDSYIPVPERPMRAAVPHARRGRIRDQGPWHRGHRPDRAGPRRGR